MDRLSIVNLALSSSLIVLSSIPICLSFSRRRKFATTHAISYYQDEDGEASESSLKAFGDKWSWRCIAGLSLVGLMCTSATVIIVTNRGSYEVVLPLLWCQLAGWVLSILQTVAIFAEPSVTQRFTLAHCAFWTSVGLTTFVAFDKVFWLHHDTTMISLQIATGTTAIIRAICCLLVPRRPDVYHQEKVVDQEHTSSLWSRLTFGYISPFIRSIGRNKSLSIEILPQLPFQARSEHLHDNLQHAHRQGRSLFLALCKVHSRALVLQVTLSLVSGLLTFGPQIVLYGILRGLENRSRGNPSIWAAVLGVTMCLASSLSSWLWWITYSQLAIPIYSELLALLYDKVMRRKVIHQVNQAVDDADQPSEHPQEQGQQEIINLATIDTKRIADYSSYNHLIPSSVTQFVVACALLLRLIGWQSLLAGLGVNFLASPLNLFVAKVYRSFQHRMMHARDQRTAIVHEVVKNIRQIKFSALEPAWQNQVLEARRHELRLTLKGCLYETIFQAMWTLTPLLLSAVSLTVYALKYGRLEASVAFTAISIFGSLEVALAALPHLISSALEAKISVDRVGKCMRGPDKAQSRSSDSDTIIFQDASVAWSVAEKNENMGFRLSGLNIKIPQKSLTVVTGRTGSGKSLLLSSILGECDIMSGSVQIPSSGPEFTKSPPTSADDWIIDAAIAFVAQNPWTEDGTIKNNILFGLPFDRIRYREVLFASGLERDLEIMPDGDQTDIGANGINLSGGQRLRVSFARALYSRAGILIMDDIFSALDADTSHHVHEYGLTGPLAVNRTRVLATHHIDLCLPSTDYCVVLADGSTSFVGSSEDFRKMDVFPDLPDKRDDDNSQNDRSSRPNDQTLHDDNREGQKFSLEEQRATGSIPLEVYKKFVTGEKYPWMWVLGLLVSLLYTVFFVGRSWWLNIWTGADQTKVSFFPRSPLVYMNLAIQQVQQMEVPADLSKYIGVYVGLSFLASLMGTLRFLLIRVASMRSSQALFENILSAVLAAPLRWVDTVPLGRVLNRFTSDIYIMDYLGSNLADLFLWTLQTCGILVATVIVSPIFLVPAAVLLAVSLRLSTVYLRVAREVKRLESVSKTPILEQFTSSIVGLTTIRAFDQTCIYVDSMFACIDDYSKVSRNLWLLNWWLQLRINLLGAIFSTIIASLVVKFGVSSSQAGFAISLLLQYNNAVSSMIRFYANFEMDMNAAERVIEYANIETEPQGGLDPPAAWPTKGRLTVDNLVVSYGPELLPVLKGLTFTIESNERVGVVGRTGSGKSTLALALFRFMEARQGQAFIDGLDISKIKLQALRRGLAIVPQHPTLFTGTIRSNLDPFDWYSETELNDALGRVHLISTDKKETVPYSLETAVSEGGENFSQGQRQLICLARAILQQPKIMILDEATSAVDKETDIYIQQTIRSEFGRNMGSLLVIAHRLSTIADFDRILVMDDGKVVEFGTPRELLTIQGGLFQELVNQSGEKALLEKVILETPKDSGG